MPDEYRLTLTPLGLIFRTPEALALAAREVRGILTAAVLDLEREVVERTPRGATGLLQASVFGEVRGDGLALRGIVAASQLYAPVVELGRRPGRFPPLGPIQLWVRRKLNVPEARVRGVAFVIARKIARLGFPGRFMFRDALADRREAIERSMEQTAQRIAERLEGD